MFHGVFSNYRYFINKNRVIAVSTFAGKTVRGVATCADSDSFDIEKGKHLAAARCNEKVAKKRYARAKNEYAKATKEFDKSLAHLTKMQQYMEDSYVAYNGAAQLVDKIVKSY